VIALAGRVTLSALAARHGGAARGSATIEGVARLEDAGRGQLAPLLSLRYLAEAVRSVERGAAILVDAALASRLPSGAPVWEHAEATWALAGVLESCVLARSAPVTGEGTTLGPNVVLHDGVVIGKNVTIAAGTVIGAPGFGWARGPAGETKRVPQLGGVVIEDGVEIGASCTIDAGTLGPTRIRRGAKLDAQVHVGHNVDIGEGCLVAAQSGFAGSVVLGRGVLVGGQVGVADHVRVGDGARIAAKSGVIGDVPAGATVAGYPAVPRGRWLRALARLHRGLS
jgi:UDP-3-O-[3-hydroxymyristoyl] glucosamine N-acyltransferase